MNKFWERFFHFFTFVAQGPSYLIPKAYSILHQRHHKYSDTERDPHSPVVHPSPIKMMLLTYKQYNAAVSESVHGNSDVAKVYPEWKIIDQLGDSWAMRILWGVIYFMIYQVAAVPLYLYPLILVHFFMGPIQGAIVNWCGHKLGYRNYPSDDNSKNTLPIDFALMGELYQNNHHRFPLSLNFATRFFELDLTYLTSLPLIWLGIIKPTRAH